MNDPLEKISTAIANAQDDGMRGLLMRARDRILSKSGDAEVAAAHANKYITGELVRRGYSEPIEQVREREQSMQEETVPSSTLAKYFEKHALGFIDGNGGIYIKPEAAEVMAQAIMNSNYFRKYLIGGVDVGDDQIAMGKRAQKFFRKSLKNVLTTSVNYVDDLFEAFRKGDFDAMKTIQKEIREPKKGAKEDKPQEKKQEAAT